VSSSHAADIGDVGRTRIALTGLVQGVGFRPFVYRLAVRHHLTGFVLNESGGVRIEIEGTAPDRLAFIQDLRAGEHPLAVIDSFATVEALVEGGTAFEIVESEPGPGRTVVPADLAVCAECVGELLNPDDRRYRHPFISCTLCGPRFTIIRTTPYDRPGTSMSPFPLCAACRAEFDDPAGRRFHAQTIACHDCGPVLTWIDTEGVRAVGDEALAAATRTLREGGTIAVEGIGGYHLACDATEDEAVSTLRRRKARSGKPFAVMVPNLATAAQLVDMSAALSADLQDRRGRIVLARKRIDGDLRLAEGIADGIAELGLILPYSPVHVLLFADTEPVLQAIVMTSANRTDEPIVTSTTDAHHRLAGLVDGWLEHNREILTPCEDSVVRRHGGEMQPVRRSRGYAPLPIDLPVAIAPTVALGGDLKTTVCLADRRTAWMSAHIGDMSQVRSTQALEDVIAHLSALMSVDVEQFVVDRHPGYRTRQWAFAAAAGRAVVEVQHHHAHAASLIIDSGHNPDEPLLAVTFDGAGFGDDGSIWGGEILRCTLRESQRVASLDSVWQPGGDIAARRPYRMALSHLAAAGVPWTPDLPPVSACPPDELRVIAVQCRNGLASARTSSMGRLFDAMSSLSGVCQDASYEAEAAMRLESMAASARAQDLRRYAFTVHDDDGLVRIDPSSVIAAVARDTTTGCDPAGIAFSFHQAVAAAVTDACRILRAKHGISTVGLTGGVFLNALLTELTHSRLTEADFTVLQHRHVPPSDAGIALGQIGVASFRRE